MWNDWVRTVNRRGHRTTLTLPMIERLEPRCVLNGSPASMMYGDAPLAIGKIGDSEVAAIVAGPQSFAEGPSYSAHGPVNEFGESPVGRNAAPVASRVINNYEPGPSNYAGLESLDVGTNLLIGPSNVPEMILVISLSSNGAGNLHVVPAFSVPSPETDSSVVDNLHDDAPKADVAVNSRPAPGPMTSANAVAIQSPNTPLHPAPQVGFDSANVATAAQPPAAKTPIVASVNQALATTVHETGFWYTSGNVGPAASSAIVFDAPLGQDFFAADLKATTKLEQALGNHKGALVNLSHTDDVSHSPVQKASLANIPLNINGVTKALERVMGELGHLGTNFTDWLDAQHLTAAAITVSVITIGGGTAIYLRRRGSKQAQKRDDEDASTSWLFARLKSDPDAS
jgi:hypothetical protein